MPDKPDPEVYGRIEFFDGTTVHDLTIGVYYGGNLDTYAEDVLLDRGYVLRHRFGAQRPATEEERAAVGWTW